MEIKPINPFHGSAGRAASRATGRDKLGKRIVKKASNEGLEPADLGLEVSDQRPFLLQCQKGSKCPGFRGSPQEKRTSDIVRFGYAKAVNDKKVPDDIGSGVFVLQKVA
jgi:hypothetical protein